MIISTSIIGSETRRIANEYTSDLSYPYRGEIASISNFKFSCKKRNGGYLKPSWGSIEIIPSAFTNIWPPPSTITLPLQAVKDDLTILDIASLTAVLSDIEETAVKYNLYGQSFDTKISSGYSGTMIGYFTWACNSARLNLTLDSSKATNYNIAINITSEVLLIDTLDSIAADLNHCFRIEGGKLYLIDLLSVGATHNLRYFDSVESPSYAGPTPYSSFKAETYTVTGDYPYGTIWNAGYMFSTVKADMEAQLARAKTILNKSWITIKIPVGNYDIKYGDVLAWIDEDQLYPLSVSMQAREFNYTIDDSKETVLISGEGTLSAV